MTIRTRRRAPARQVRSGSPRPHRWRRRRLLVIAAGLVVIVVTAFVLAIKLQPVPAPLALPAAGSGPPAGPADGSWEVTAGSAAGFRVNETVFGLSNDVVGRTSAVTGTVVISGRRVTSATFRIDLTAMKVGHRTSPQLDE